MTPNNAPHNALRHHVSGAVERGEVEPIAEIRVRVRDVSNEPTKLATVTLTEDDVIGTEIDVGTHTIEMPTDYDPALITAEDIQHDGDLVIREKHVEAAIDLTDLPRASHVEIYETGGGVLYLRPVGQGIVIEMPETGDALSDCRLYGTDWYAHECPEHVYDEGPVLAEDGIHHVATYRPGIGDRLEIETTTPGRAAQRYLGARIEGSAEALADVPDPDPEDDGDAPKWATLGGLPMPKLTKSTFELIADAIHDFGYPSERDRLAQHFANKLKDTNPQFNRARFIERATRED